VAQGQGKAFVSSMADTPLRELARALARIVTVGVWRGKWKGHVLPSLFGREQILARQVLNWDMSKALAASAQIVVRP
jgi:hypothetical protein